MDERSERTAITQDYVLQGIQDVTEATRKEQPAVALKGYELLGKHLKLFTEKLELGADASLAEAISAARQRRDNS
jgi:phage terminase small subunit